VLTGSPFPTAAEDRVYALVLPDGMARPAITYQRITSTPINDVGGHSGLDQVQLQVDCWADTYGAAKELAEQVRVVMQAASFMALLLTDEDEFEKESKLYRVRSDYLLWQAD
jgi:hypothetical protein